MSGGGSSRQKGHGFERELVTWFKSHGIEARRGYQSRGGGAEQADVILPGLPYHVEAKRPAKCAVYAYMEQAERDSKDSGLTPVVLLRANGKQALVLMRANDWINYVKS